MSVFEMGSHLHSLIQEEMKQIVRVQALILSELDDIYTLTKENGSLDVAITEAIASIEQAAIATKIKIDQNSIEECKKHKNEFEKLFN